MQPISARARLTSPGAVFAQRRKNPLNVGRQVRVNVLRRCQADASKNLCRW